MTERPGEIDAITLSNVKREVEPLKSEMRTLRTGHLTATVARVPWSPQEKRRHETDGRAEDDEWCEICVKSPGISRHPRCVFFTVLCVRFRECHVQGSGYDRHGVSRSRTSC